MSRLSICVIFLLSLSAFASVDQEKLANSLNRIEENRSKKGPYQIEVLGIKYWAHHNVFSPEFFASTAIQNRNFPFRKDESFLDLGTGVGVTAVIAAKDYNNKVVALDINPDAVEIAQKNFRLHGLGDRVDCRVSDVFSALADNEKFDTIYWDLPYVRSNDDAQLDLLQRAVSDPGYSHIKRFIHEAKMHLNPNGRLIVGFGSLGDRALLDELACENMFQVIELSTEQHPYRGGISYSLLALRSIKDHKQEL